MSFLSWNRSVTTPRRFASVMSADSFGLAFFSQRRWVMPLVLLVNFSGHIYRVAEGFGLGISVCSAATPLTAWPPTIARFAIRTRFSPPPR